MRPISFCVIAEDSTLGFKTKHFLRSRAGRYAHELEIVHSVAHSRIISHLFVSLHDVTHSQCFVRLDKMSNKNL
jgi:hypothetical protein